MGITKRDFTQLAGHVILAAMAGCIALLTYSTVAHRSTLLTLSGFLRYIAFPLAMIMALVGAYRMSGDRRTNVALFLLAFGLSLYTAEAALVISNHLSDRRFRVAPECESVIAGGPGDHAGRGSGLLTVWELNCTAALEAGEPFDRRTQLAVIEDAEQHGDILWPVIPPSDLLREGSRVTLDGSATLPLGGIANVPTLHCNEGGFYVTYHSDEHGFRNPPGLHEPPIDVGLVGDSYTHGNCVRPGSEIAAVLRESEPRTLSVGMVGHGPLLELASIKQYLAPLAPRIVVWLFYEHNDLANLNHEKRFPVLRRYLTDTVDVELREHQAEIDRQLMALIRLARRHADSLLANPLPAPPETVSWVAPAVARFLLIANLRHGVRALRRRTQGGAFPFDDELFRRVMVSAQEVINGWGGTLYFVYLPSWWTFVGERHGDEYRDSVLAVVRDLGITVIDAQRVFEEHDDPLSLFPFRNNGHYTPTGYRLVANAVLETIRHPSQRSPSVP